MTHVAKPAIAILKFALGKLGQPIETEGFDAKTGEVKYDGGRVPVPTSFTSSAVAYDGKILLTSEDGDTFVIKAGPKHEVLRTNSLGEVVLASIAIADGRLFIRGDKHLYCIGKQN